MSRYMIRKDNYKLVVYGTRKEVDDQLFDLDSDPQEMENIALKNEKLVQELKNSLESVIDFSQVSKDVAKYNKGSFKIWMEKTKNWEEEISKGSLRQPKSWNSNNASSFEALDKWLKSEDQVLACRDHL